MESLNDEGDKAPTRHLFPSNENSSVRNGLYLIEVLAKECPWKTPEQPRLLLRLLAALQN